jgi:hypothetical protein
VRNSDEAIAVARVGKGVGLRVGLGTVDERWEGVGDGTWA